MSAQITINTCSHCHGNGIVQELVERTIADAAVWVPCLSLPHDLADAWIASDPNAPIRWQDCDCPQCGGAGEYEVEHVTCKIF